jgi:hypothetical protein
MVKLPWYHNQNFKQPKKLKQYFVKKLYYFKKYKIEKF